MIERTGDVGCLTWAALLDAIYPPVSSATLEAYERAHHRDLPQLALAEPRRERERLDDVEESAR